MVTWGSTLDKKHQNGPDLSPQKLSFAVDGPNACAVVAADTVAEGETSHCLHAMWQPHDPHLATQEIR